MKNPIRKYFQKIGAKGGKKRGEAWARLSEAERSAEMSALAKKRWNKKKKAA